jgi:HEAT repeat protein
MKVVIGLAFLFSSLNSYAAIPREKPSLEKILEQKNSAKFDTLKKMGPDVYKDLKKIAFNDERNLGLRWQAFMAMVKLGEKEALPEVEVAAKSKDWFLRNAAIKVAPLLNKEKAYDLSLKGLADSSLIVRTQAVDSLGKVKKSDCADDLWKHLYSKDNFHKKQSLWIRRHIVEVLAELSPAGTESYFIKVLDDADSSLFSPAIKGLERLTGQNLGEAQMPAVYKRYLWKKWFENKTKKT